MLQCQTVLIKFFDKSAPQQEVSYMHVTGAKLIQVKRDSQFLELAIVTANGKPIKNIAYNIEDVKEFACEGVLWEDIK